VFGNPVWVPPRYSTAGAPGEIFIGAGDFVVAIAGFASFIIWLTLADFWGSGYFGRPDAAAEAIVRR
jgi:hypothetical protein